MRRIQRIEAPDWRPRLPRTKIRSFHRRRLSRYASGCWCEIRDPGALGTQDRTRRDRRTGIRKSRYGNPKRLGGDHLRWRTQDERDANQTLAVIERQLAGSVPDMATSANTVVAYEPVWAIGTGRVPTVAQITEVHLAIHAALKNRFEDDGGSVSVLYGGSVKPSNAQSIFAIEYVDGALVGGASLKASDFSAIAEALNA